MRLVEARKSLQALRARILLMFMSIQVEAISKLPKQWDTRIEQCASGDGVGWMRR